ncbi:MAG: vitamin K epoxide reductase family protein [Candidatus Acetothermia bacterium]|nr:vitamin K epoxide reductase family protein [Candidatus Acetothermia bacterium]
MRLVISLLALLGLGVSAYLAYEHFCGPIVCIGSGCAIVNESVYCRIFGVPLSVLGLLNYALILGLAIASLRVKNPLSSWLHLGIFGLALSGTIFSAYLTYLEFAVIRAFCTWCVVSAVTITAIFALSSLKLTDPRRGD